MSSGEDSQGGLKSPKPLSDSAVVNVNNEKDGNTSSKDDAKKEEDTSFKNWKRVFNYADKKAWILNGVAVFCMIAAGTLLPIMNIVFGRFVTVFQEFAVGIMSPAQYRDKVNEYTLFFVYLFIGKFVLAYIWTTIIAATAIRTTKSLRVALLEHTLRQDIGYFDSVATGTISSLVTTNGNLVTQSISEKLGLMIQAISTFIAAFIVAFTAQWKLTLIIMCIVPVNLVVTTVCVMIEIAIETDFIKINAEGGKLAEEVFSSIRNVHAFWAYPRMAKKFGEILDRAEKVGMKKSLNYVVLFSVEFFAIFCGYALAFWQGIRMYARGEIEDAGKVVTVIFAVIVAAQALTAIAPQSMAISKGMAAADEIFKSIDRKSNIDSLSPDGEKPDDCVGDLELQDVYFSYPSRPDIPVLKGMSLKIPACKTTALIGASGSGKSTIVGLIERWYNVSSGCVRLDGHDIKRVNIRWLRTHVRIVQQEPILFSGTIFQNVANGLAGTGLADSSEEEKERLVKEACRAAFACEFIEKLPHGYHTKIGERGASLSGGQKQRIAIARAIISNPHVLLLDEATSALDPTAEKIVQRALNNVAIGRTMVVIAHRLSTIRDADNIVVMQDGAIVEQGTHDELLGREDSAYGRLIAMQDLGQRGRDDAEEEEEERERGEGEAADKGNLNLMRTISTRVSSTYGRHGVPEEELEIKFQYGLAKCIYLIIKEQRGLWWWFWGMLVICVLSGATYPGLAVLFSRTMTAFEQPTPEKMIDRGDYYSLMFFVIALGNLLLYGALGIVCNKIAQVIVKSYRGEIFQNILRQPMSFFDKPPNTVGALSSRLAAMPNDMLELFAMNIGILAIAVFNLLASCSLAIAYGWKLGLVLTFAALPPLVGSGYARIRLEFKLDDDTSARFANSAGLAAEAVTAIRTVSSLALEIEVVDKFQDSLQGIVKRSIRSLLGTMFWYALSQSISFLAMGLGFWYGGRLVSTGEYTSEKFYVVFIAIIFSGEAAALFFTYGTTLTKARTATNWILTLRSTVAPSFSPQSPPNTEKSPSPASTEEGPEIGLKELCFSYPSRPHTKVLRSITATIPAGSFVALVGPSGCGKTTILSLLERFYDPTSGTISMDGRDVKQVGLREYRRGISLVQQEPVLYQGSIGENVGIGRRDDGVDVLDYQHDGRELAGDGEEGDKEILEACAQANIKEFILSLPEGLNTPVGSQGLQLSGGQRQRIAIARALIRRPRLLLLDEATSALDSESEGVVKKALDEAAKVGGRTTVAVAHRLSTVRNADVIVVFVGGRVVEWGAHEELVGKKGVYWEMCRGQALDKHS